MIKRKKSVFVFIALLIGICLRIGYLAIKYPDFTKQVFPSEKRFSYQAYDYELGDGAVITKEMDKDLESKLIDDQVVLRFNLQTTDLRVISDYLLDIDGYSFYPSYELLEKISDNHYVLSYAVSEQLLTSQNQKAFIALPNQTVKNQSHAVVSVRIKKD